MEFSSCTRGNDTPPGFSGERRVRRIPEDFPHRSRSRPSFCTGMYRSPTGSQPFPGSYSGIPTVSLKTSSLFPAATLPFLKRDMAFSLDGPKADRRGEKDVTGDENYGLNFYGESSDPPLPLPTYTYH